MVRVLYCVSMFIAYDCVKQTKTTKMFEGKLNSSKMTACLGHFGHGWMTCGEQACRKIKVSFVHIQISQYSLTVQFKTLTSIMSFVS